MIKLTFDYRKSLFDSSYLVKLWVELYYSSPVTKRRERQKVNKLNKWLFSRSCVSLDEIIIVKYGLNNISLDELKALRYLLDEVKVEEGPFMALSYAINRIKNLLLFVFTVCIASPLFKIRPINFKLTDSFFEFLYYAVLYTFIGLFYGRELWSILSSYHKKKQIEKILPKLVYEVISEKEINQQLK